MTPRRAALLKEMGLAPLWRLRSAAGSDEAECGASSSEQAAPATADMQLAAPVSDQARGGTAPAVATPAASAMPPEDWARPGARTTEPQRPDVAGEPDARTRSAPARAARIASLDWEGLEADIRACSACRLCERRRQAVPGVGDREARWMLVGEGPGAEEDQRGEPFVGAAGKLLDAMLASVGLRRGEDVYIANAVKCRPPLNRTPESDEVAACLPYLERQIELVRPRLLVALGRPAAQALLDTEVRIGAARGRVHRRGDTPVVVTYHPAYLLRNQADKAKAWEDLCFARRLMNEQTEG